MQIQPDCLPCVLRISIECLGLSCKKGTDLYDTILKEILLEIQEFENHETAPELISTIQKRIKSATEKVDPYSALKERDVEIAYSLLTHIRNIYSNETKIELKTALLISAIGNTLDSGISLNDELSGNIEKELNKGFAIFDDNKFEERLKAAKTVLVIGDNIGEAVLDYFIIKKLESKKIVYAVRKSPILNDVSFEDIIKIGMDEVNYISSGSDIAGTVLTKCSEEFLKIFYSADVVISKGLGNYETLSECDRDIFYLFKAKCDVIAKEVGVHRNEYVFIHSMVSTKL